MEAPHPTAGQAERSQPGGRSGAHPERAAFLPLPIPGPSGGPAPASRPGGALADAGYMKSARPPGRKVAAAAGSGLGHAFIPGAKNTRAWERGWMDRPSRARPRPAASGAGPKEPEPGRLWRGQESQRGRAQNSVSDPAPRA